MAAALLLVRPSKILASTSNSYEAQRRSICTGSLSLGIVVVFGYARSLVRGLLFESFARVCLAGGANCLSGGRQLCIPSAEPQSHRATEPESQSHRRVSTERLPHIFLAAGCELNICGRALVSGFSRWRRNAGLCRVGKAKREKTLFQLLPTQHLQLAGNISGWF